MTLAAAPQRQLKPEDRSEVVGLCLTLELGEAADDAEVGYRDSGLGELGGPCDERRHTRRRLQQREIGPNMQVREPTERRRIDLRARRASDPNDLAFP